MKIKQLSIAIGVCVGLCVVAQAQEKVYFKNGTAMNWHLTEANNNKLTYDFASKDGGRLVESNISRNDIAIVFGANGNFIATPDILTTRASEMQLRKFYAKARPATDLLVQKIGLKVIPANIKSDSRGEIGYVNLAGKEIKINKNELSFIVYKDGHHEFLDSFRNVFEMVEKNYADIQRQINNPIDLPTPPEPDKPVMPVKPDTTTKRNLPPPQPPVTEPAKMTDSELNENRQKGKDMATDFTRYLGLIADKSKTMAQRDAAIAEVLKLFLKDATIQVSSSRSKEVKTHKIGEYLKLIKALPYKNVKITWGELQYVNDFKQDSDGNYRGILRGTQTFVGDQFSDVTTKNIPVEAQPLTTFVNGQKSLKWEVRLGTISIEI